MVSANVWLGVDGGDMVMAMDGMEWLVVVVLGVPHACRVPMKSHRFRVRWTWGESSNIVLHNNTTTSSAFFTGRCAV